MSLESQFGWHDLRFALGAWPERITSSINRGDRERDERDFYLCFFVQCWSLTDWAKESGLISNEELSSYIRSYDCMLLCRDIATRYKHLTIRSPAMFDKSWSIWEDSDGVKPVLMLTASDKSWALWDLMLQCIDFWESLAAALGLDENQTIYRPQ